LYRLLSGVNKTHASLMVTLVLVSVPITFVNVLNEIASSTEGIRAASLRAEERRLDGGAQCPSYS